MVQKRYILVKRFCEKSHIEDTFVQNLFEYGLVTYQEKENELFIDENDISEIERLFRLHHDLGINFEGLDVIKRMMKRMEKLEREMDRIQKRLQLYE